MMEKKLWVKVLSIILVIFCFGFMFVINVNAKEKVFKWKFVCDFPPTDLTMAECVPRLAEWIERDSNGRIKVEVYSGGQLVPPDQSFENLRAGTFQLLQTCGAYHGGILPVATPSFVLPMGPRDQRDLVKLYSKYGLYNLMSEAYESVGVKYLANTPYSGANIISKKPVRTLEDFKGLKLRAVGLQSALWSAVGATPVYIPGGEIYLALQTGVIDAAAWANPSVEGMKFGEVTDYMICGFPLPPGLCTTVCNGTLLVNKKAFEELPKDLQEIVVRCAWQFSQWTTVKFQEWDDWFYDKGKDEYNMEVIELSEEDTKKMREMAIKEIWPKVAEKSKYSAKYIEIVTQFLKDENVIE